MKNRDKKTKVEKTIVISQVLSLMIEIIAFAFIIGGMTVGISEKVSAAADSTTVPIENGCCLEAKDGSLCQLMNKVDEGSCKNPLIATSCSEVQQCQVGCCYDPAGGSCSLNSPQQKCIDNGGNWSKTATCNIPQCQLGCCILGDQASITTTRECTLLSNDNDFEKNFQSLDPDGTCKSKVGLSQKGACVTPSSDYSNENDCKFTTKGNCKSGSFYQGYLCTAPDLKTSCKPSSDTTCVSGEDQIYYLDSCGNTANIYDASKLDDISYWTDIIPASSSCSPASADCGNCDYMTGSRCADYRSGKDTKATYGDKVCRNLNCLNGRKHGESWCVDDYDNSKDAVAPVGARSFVGKCLDGEITIEPCADFNQQICVQETSEGMTEAQCTMNDWRSCISANDKGNYYAVKAECDKNSQCIMFDKIAGNDKYSELPGFKTEVDISDQGAAGDVGKDSNKVIPWCVPKYTPGMVFWNTDDATKKFTVPTGDGSSTSSLTNTNQQNQQSYAGLDYGGSLQETAAICSLGSFTCVSHKKRTCYLGGDPSNPENFLGSTSLCIGTAGISSLSSGKVDCDPWEDEENWECTPNAVSPDAKEKSSLTLEALNERCRSLGPCGINVNVAGELGSNGDINSTIKVSKINEKGKNVKGTSAGYAFSEDYLASIAGKSGLVKAGTLTTLTAAVIAILTGRVTETTTQEQEAQAAIGQNGPTSTQTEVSGLGGSLGVMGAGMIPSATANVAANAMAPAGTYVAGTFTVQGAQQIVYITASSQYPVTITAVQGGYQVTQAGTGWSFSTTQSVMTKTPAQGQGLSGTYALGQAAGGLIGMAAGYLIGKMIVKKMGWSPGRSQQFIAGMMALGSTIGVGVMTYILWSSCTFGPLGCLAGLIIALIISIYTNCIDNSYDEQSYEITQYNCEAWQPPMQGDCNACNNDIRTCSEQRCRSLGMNCHYYNENGEPGYCAALDATWSAHISPWPEAISNGSKYTDITDKGFKIEGVDSEEVGAWSNLQFGIITDDRASCKLDTVHTKTIDEMKYDFIIDNQIGCAGENCGSQGTNHKIVLSPFVNANSSSANMPPLVEGENNYYIRCRNFAGAVNEGEFAVKVVRGKEPDVTSPLITRFDPADYKWVKQGVNTSAINFFVNEPSTCKYSQNVDNRYEDMTGNASCYTDPDFGIMGEWACFTPVANLISGDNKFYFQCKDQPDIDPRMTSKQNINRNSKQYTVKVCTSGLNITKLEPKNIPLVGQAPISMTMTAETKGCVNGGIASCAYSFNSYGENATYIEFLNTNSVKHSQTFTSMPAGINNISVRCADVAGNIAYDSLMVNVTIDNTAPVILRAYDLNNQLTVTTNENSKCKYTINESIACDFDFEGSNSSIINMNGEGTTHTSLWVDSQEYYIKCQDVFGNTNSLCGISIKAA